MATSTIKARDEVSGAISITNQDTTYLAQILFRKVGRIVYCESTAIKVNTAITATSDIALGTVPNSIIPRDGATIPVFNRNSGTFGELSIGTNGSVSFNKRSGTFNANTYCSVSSNSYIAAN